MATTTSARDQRARRRVADDTDSLRTTIATRLGLASDAQGVVDDVIVCRDLVRRRDGDEGLDAARR